MPKLTKEDVINQVYSIDKLNSEQNRVIRTETILKFNHDWTPYSGGIRLNTIYLEHKEIFMRLDEVIHCICYPDSTDIDDKFDYVDKLIQEIETKPYICDEGVVLDIKEWFKVEVMRIKKRPRISMKDRIKFISKS